MGTRLAAAFTLLLASLCGGGAAAQTAEADSGLVDEGRYLVTAGDCAGCHSPSLAGGDPVPTPIGSIYATNITPDPETGIGDWTLAQLSKALRKGRAPRGHLYPAMPYTSYTGLSDQQIHAIYSYLMLGVEPVRNMPPETKLPFPFVRPAVLVWNALFLRKGRPVGAVAVQGEEQARGQMLVETLGHCTTCHTPRGQFMQQDADRHLGGAMVGNWWAPNITPHESGIGGWNDERLATFLRTGHTDVAVAAGEMAKVVSRSLSKLPARDIDAIVSYLRAVPPVASDSHAAPVAVPTAPTPVAAVEPAGDIGWRALLEHDTVQGDLLYQSACASCHGLDGSGSAGLTHPSLRLVNGVTTPQNVTLVQVIAHGVDRTVDGHRILMPGFRGSLSDDQIASLANYVRTSFGGVESNLDAAEVETILDGELEVPWLIRNAGWLTFLGIVVAVLVILAIVWTITRSRRRTLPARRARAESG